MSICCAATDTPTTSVANAMVQDFIIRVKQSDGQAKPRRCAFRDCPAPRLHVSSGGNHLPHDVRGRRIRRPAVERRSRAVFEHQLHFLRDSRSTHFRGHDQAEINAGCDTAAGDAASIDDDALVHRLCPEQSQEVPRAPWVVAR